jgi:hypothetical protein
MAVTLRRIVTCNGVAATATKVKKVKIFLFQAVEAHRVARG